MKYQLLDCAQRSPEWYTARCGKLTSTAAKDMLAEIKSGEAAARRDLRLRLVTERLIGQPQETDFVSKEMQRGIDCEPLARAAYEAATGRVVTPIGFCQSRDWQAGCSPDGVIGDFEGVLELKCPKSATHLKYVRSGDIPPEHLAQLIHTLWITGAPWIDFASWDDRFPTTLQLFCARLTPNPDTLTRYEAAAIKFLDEVEREYHAVLELSQRYVP